MRTVTALVSILFYLFVTVYAVAYYALFFVVFLLCLPFDRERVVIHVLSAFWARSVFRLNPLWRVRVEGREHVRRGSAYVITANHRSMLDIPLLYAVPLRLKWVSKREVYRIPLFGWILWMHGDIAIRRGSRRSAIELLDKGTAHLRRGTSVIIFPEGTRSRDGEVHRFREGAFALAKRAGCPILPVVHTGTGRALDGWRMVPCTFRVRILPPVPVEETAVLDERELAARVESLTVRALEALRKGDNR